LTARRAKSTLRSGCRFEGFAASLPPRMTIE
jgi:hypothetical protein